MGFPGGSAVKNPSAKQKIWVRFLGQEAPLEEKEMTSDSNIPAWEKPRIEEPGRLQSMGSQSRTRLSN